MANSGTIYFECPWCKGDVEMTAEDALEVHTLVHQECGTVLQYDPASRALPLIILPGQP
jgi:hypothetical protein